MTNAMHQLQIFRSIQYENITGVIDKA